MSHKLRQIEDGVNRTHKGLGRLVAVSILCLKAGKCLITIAPRGTGKSQTCKALTRCQPDVLAYDSVTRASLRRIQPQLTGFNGLVWIDDLGAVESPYSRVASATTFCKLCHDHFVYKLSHVVSVNITDFYGSSILNVQPAVLNDLVRDPQWEAHISDKSIRFYHLVRPTSPNEQVPELGRLNSPRLSDVELRGIGKDKLQKLHDIGMSQWSRARVQYHIADFLKACASIDGRKRVTQEDISILEHILKPMLVEKYVLRSEHLEGKKSLDHNLLGLMTEFASYKEVDLKTIAQDYKRDEATVAKILRKYPEYFITVQRMPDVFRPSKKLVNILKEVGAIGDEGV